MYFGRGLLTYATSLLFYILTILYVFLEKKPNADRPYKAFGYPFVPALYIVVTVAFLLIYDTFNTGLGLCIVALGIPVYYFVMNKKEQN
jgi:APA family basic amino acid/polyamine antiporter